MNIFTYSERTNKTIFPAQAITAAKIILEDRTGQNNVNVSYLNKINLNKKVTIEQFNKITQQLLIDSHPLFQ